MRHSVTTRLLAAIVPLVLVLAACGAGGASSPPPVSEPEATQSAAASAPEETTAAGPTMPADPTDVVFLTDFSIFGYTAAFFAGIDQGFFIDQGINLEIQPGAGSSDTTAKVAGGAAQFGLADPVAVVPAVSQDAPVIMVASHWQSNQNGYCFDTANVQIDELADFEGISIGGTAGSPTDVMLQKIMELDGLDPSTITFETMDSSTSSAAVISGQIDATSCGQATFPSRKLTAAEAGVDMGHFNLALDAGLVALGHSIIANTDVVSEDPDLVVRFLTAYAESVIWSRENVDEAIAAFVEANPDQNPEGAKAAFEATLPFALDIEYGDQQFVFPAEKADATVEQYNEWLDFDVDPADVYTNEFVSQLPAGLLNGELP